MKPWKIILLVGIFVVTMVGLSYGFGWIGVHQTKTIGKAQKNAEREVFEQTQSYVMAKRQEALKLYKEYKAANTNEEKESIKQIASHSFAEFDETKLEGPIYNFIYDCKYNP
jgi:hypothetical protein